MRVEEKILSGLLTNEEYARKVIPFIQEEYFQDDKEKVLFSKIRKFIETYGALPTRDALHIELEKDTSLRESTFKEASALLSSIPKCQDNVDWLVDTTETFCCDSATYNAVKTAVKILDGDHPTLSKGAIPELLTKALSVSFDAHIGHDYIEQADERFEFYHHKESRIPFDIDWLNLITRGGIPKKTFNVILASTGVGKTLAMCHFAAYNLLCGKNVLYITLEMAQERIAERIDANLLNIPINDLPLYSKERYSGKIEELKYKTSGKLIVKEYPTAACGAGHFRHLMNELYLKKSFTPDIVYVDYVNICSSMRFRGNSNSGSYNYVKSICEELRGLAVEKDVPMISATQVNRTGAESSDLDLTDTSESFGLPMTVDFMFAMISNEELDAANQVMFKQLKNRYNDASKNRRALVGIDRSKMRLFNLESSAQKGIQDESDLNDEVPTQERKFDDFK